jgi:hypothetical protein
MNKWLQNLQRIPHAMPAPVFGKLNEFSELFDATDQGGLPVVAGTKLSKVFDDGASDDPDPIGMLLQKLDRNPEAEGRHDAKPHIHPPAEELAEIEAAWEELLGGHAIGSEDGTKASKRYHQARAVIDRMFKDHPEEHAEALALVRRLAVETALDNTTKADGGPLAKAEISSRMARLLSELRGDCIGSEQAQLEKALAALDLGAFTQITTSIIERLKRQRAA